MTLTHSHKTPDTLIIIPARYHSSRFPGKPLQTLAGKSMLQRVYETASQAIQQLNTQFPEHLADVKIATEDQRIVDHAASFGAEAVITSDDCLSGTDRAFAACQLLASPPKWVINFQGDSPLTPPELLCDLAKALYQNAHWPVVTPVLNLTWQQLDDLRQQKTITPFSGTTAILGQDNQALWFSKQIIPAIRNEAQRKQETRLSPVYLHAGLYGYQYEALTSSVNLPPGPYETLEGLEQLRLIEHRIPIHLIQMKPEFSRVLLGVDTPEDAKRASDLLATVDD